MPELSPAGQRFIDGASHLFLKIILYLQHLFPTGNGAGMNSHAVLTELRLLYYQIIQISTLYLRFYMGIPYSGPRHSPDNNVPPQQMLWRRDTISIFRVASCSFRQAS